jgi:hypothetical protein
MHAWRHELGEHTGVLAADYGPDLPALLTAAGDCPDTRRTDVADLLPEPRRARVPAVA